VTPSREFRFKYKNLPVFSGKMILNLLNSSTGFFKIDSSLGAKLREISVRILGDSIVFQTENFEIDVSRESISQIVKNPRRIYGLTKSGFLPLVLMDRDNKYYQLTLFEGCLTPTIEISGIHMHRTIVDPLFVDAKQKVLALKPKPKSEVLEICTGLGYSTYWLIRRKCHVISIEKSREVLELASWNPWSRHLKHVEILLGDATKVLQYLPDKRFSYVFHDPPRISIAPELYSSEFYSEIHRVMRPKGILFHYVGEPGKKRGKRYLRGVLRRLESAGFRILRYDARSRGITAVCIKR